MNNIDSQEIYYGSRGEDFKECIKAVLERSKLKKKYIQLLIGEEAMKMYNDVFTHSSADSTNNYEVFEQLGDLSANKFINWYMYRRFPQLNCPEGVKVVARLRINYGSKQSFWSIAQNLGFWNFITASVEERGKSMKPLLEDTMEAFIGATEWFIDSNIRINVGYGIVYDILSSIFDEKQISLQYTDLYDSKTRLKELFDFHKNLGTLKYEDSRDERITTTVIYRICENKKIILGRGSACLKADSQQMASSHAIITLKSQGYEKQIPEIYARFAEVAT